MKESESTAGSGGPSPLLPRIDVSRADRAAALLEPLPVAPAQPTPPFDRERCIARLRALGKPTTLASKLHWEGLELSPVMSAEEGWFWVRVAEGTGKLASLLDAAASAPTTPVPLDAGWQRYPPGIMAALVAAAGVRPYCHRLFAGHASTDEVRALVESWIPAMDDSTRAILREEVLARAELAPTPWAVWVLGVLELDIERLAPLVAELEPLAAGSGARRRDARARDPALLRATFGLRDPARVLEEVQRLRVLPWTAEDARAVLAAVGFRAGAVIAKAAIASNSKTEAEALVSAMALARGPLMVLPMFDALVESKASNAAREWLAENTAWVVPELLPLLAIPTGRGEAAATYLRELVQNGHRELVTAALAGRPESVLRAVQVKVLSAREHEHVAVVGAELPTWAERCFGAAANLTVERADLTAELENPSVQVDLGEVAHEAPPFPALDYVPLGAPEPFDYDACLARLLAAFGANGRPGHSYHRWDAAQCPIRLPMTSEEGRFWIEAAHAVTNRGSQTDVEQALRKGVFGSSIHRVTYSLRDWLLPAVWASGGPAQLARFPDRHDSYPFLKAVSERVLRFLAQDERDRLRYELLTVDNPAVGSLLMAQMLGATNEQLRPALLRVTDVHHAFNQPPPLLQLLRAHENPRIIAREAKRLGIHPTTESEAREWLAVTGTLGIPALREAIDNNHASGHRSGLLRVLAAVRAPEVAPVMLSLRRTSDRKAARQWMEDNIAHTVEGLVPLVGTKDKQANAATEHLRELCRRGYGWLVEKKWGGRTQVADLVLAPNAGLATPSNTDYALATRLPCAVIDTESGPRALGQANTATLLAELRSSSLSAPTPRVSTFRDNVDEQARHAFVWDLFQSWLQDGAPSKERWKMDALGHLGGEATVTALAELVRTWPGERQHQRATHGLECLRAIGSDAALVEIRWIAEKFGFHGLRERAAECFEAIARERGMSSEELADRIIPDGGLDERGSRTFDFGPRRFAFVLSDDLKPMVRDEAGKRLPNLPKPNRHDDVQRAEEALTNWKLLKSQVTEVLKTQTARLEKAMVVGRRWSPEVFHARFVQHPLMVHLVQRLVWAVYDDEGTVVDTFRVGDDGRLVSARDDGFDIPEGGVNVGVAHPLLLGLDETIAWGDILTDYEIVPLFAQLSRPTYTLTADERNAAVLRRFDGQRVDAKGLIFGLDGRGWLRGVSRRGGRFNAHSKTYGTVTAVVSYSPGCWTGTNGDDWSEQTVTGVGFMTGTEDHELTYFAWDKAASVLPLSGVDAVVVSEVLNDVTRVVRGRDA